jgi:hypothetical protein
LYDFLLCFNEKIVFCSLYCAVCWSFSLDLSLLVAQRLASQRLKFSCWPLLWRPSFLSSCPDFFCSLSLRSSFSAVSSHRRFVRCSQRFLVRQAIRCFPSQQSTVTRSGFFFSLLCERNNQQSDLAFLICGRVSTVHPARSVFPMLALPPMDSFL